MTSPTPSPTGPHADGRDEMNLADFPISVLERRPTRDASGQVRDQVVYESTVYDPIARRRTPQRVTLTTSSRYGLPTPADENVVLALLHTAKRADGCSGARVHFAPHRLFEVMRWSPNSRSYDRLSLVLRRLTSLTILYENAWWAGADRRYEGELATGIIAEYRLVKSRIRRKADELPLSYVHWAPRFHESLAAGNLKKLDLDRLFALETPTAQRMYRFLDKRFYRTPILELDLREFACGHLGVTPSPNVAELKRRLAPALAELERAGFLEPADPDDRYVKVRAGLWRIRCRRAGAGTSVEAARAGPEVPPVALAPSAYTSVNPAVITTDGARELLAAFYRAWTPESGPRPEPTATELSRARQVVALHGAAEALALVDRTAALVRSKFPQAKTFGAAVGYFDEAAREAEDRRRRASTVEDAARRRHGARAEVARRRQADDAFRDAWQPRWEALETSVRDGIVAAVLREHPYLSRPMLRTSSVAARLYLEEFARRSESPSENDGRNT
jgi:Replication initiator protein A